MLGPRARVAVAVAFFAYVLFVRTHDITSTFLLLGDQIRDWTIALGSWRDLPLTGPASVAGGRCFGPIYYWLLWAGRHAIGPFTGNLPHAGGLTVALLQSVADAWLFVALWRRLPMPLALAISLVSASQPFDVGLSATIWNPPVATALAKMTMALMLGLGETPALWRVAGTATMAWLSVQAHTAAVIVAAPVLAAIVAQPLIARQWRRGLDTLRVVVEVIVVLQIPYLVAQLSAPGESLGPTVAIDNLANAAGVDVPASFARVASLTGWLITRGDDAWPYGAVILPAALLVLWRWRRDLPLLAISVGPIVAATAVFAAWTRPYDSYWFLPLAPAVVLTVGLTLTLIPRPAVVQRLALAVLVLVALWQPSRIKASAEYFKYPQYRALLDGSRAARHRAPVLRDLRVAFAVEPSTDVHFLYRILGGRIDPAGAFTGVIQPDGTVEFTPSP